MKASNSCASLAGTVLSFIACFILLVIATLPITTYESEKDGNKWSELASTIAMSCIPECATERTAVNM